MRGERGWGQKSMSHGGDFRRDFQKWVKRGEGGGCDGVALRGVVVVGGVAFAKRRGGRGGGLKVEKRPSWPQLRGCIRMKRRTGMVRRGGGGGGWKLSPRNGKPERGGWALIKPKPSRLWSV